MNKVLTKENAYIEFKTILSKGEKIDFSKIGEIKFDINDKGQIVPKIQEKRLEDEADTYLLSRVLVKIVDNGKEWKMDKSISKTCEFLRDGCYETEDLIEEVLTEIKKNNFPVNEIKNEMGK